MKEETPDVDPGFLNQSPMPSLDTLSPSPIRSHNTRKRSRLSQEKSENVKFEEKRGEKKGGKVCFKIFKVYLIFDLGCVYE